jgi:TrmH family RNA methyltransferase
MRGPPAAAGADALVVCDPCTDLYNPNVVRASTGNLFTVQVAQADNRTTIDWLRRQQIRILAASPHASPLYWDVDLTAPLAIVVGTEQVGLSNAWMNAADIQVRLPMHGVADSLNVATATALLLYEAVRQRMAAGVVVDRGPVTEDD